jgi:iron complex outermembrane receptor protein
MKIRRNPIASAIKKALQASLLTTVAVTGVTFAQDDADKEVLDAVSVTGTRIKTTDLEGPKPITVITREDIELSGMQTAADILRTTTFNSFGSFRERSGSSGGQAALVNMRGLGASRTAVLVNGRRLPGSALFGTSAANLNAIPIAAIERVDILQGGASSVYGADAIAGVINIVLRDDYEGAEVEVGVARPDRAGGDEEHGSFVVGLNSDKGNIVFAAEFFRRNPVFDGDRDFSGVQVNGPGFSDTVGVSGYGNTGLATDYSSSFAIGECQSTENGGLYAGILTDPFGIPGTGCGFGYADVSAMTGDVNRYNTFLSANYEINENHTLYFQNTLAKIQSFGRYAPVAAGFLITADAPLNDTGEAFILGHRFVAHGPRDENFNEFDLDSIIGMNGVIWDDQVNYDGYFRSYTSTIANIGGTYVNRRAIVEAVTNGSYNFVNPLDPSNAAAVTATSQTTNRDLRVRYNEAALNFDGFAWELPAGTMGWAAGAEWSSEDYQDKYDAAREAGNTLGSAGNSSSGSRERISIFGELAIPLLDNLDMQLAARYDDYSDFGDNLSPSVSLRYQPLDNLIVRASYTEGFKAPNLTALNSARSESFNNVNDITQCQAQGISDDDCPTFQVRNFSGGNPDLESESSEGFDIGVVWEPIDNLTIGVDYFETDISDAIQQIGIQTLVNLEAAGQPLPSGTAIIRGADIGPGIPGRISQIETGFANVSEFNVTGVDVKVSYSYNTDTMGTFSTNLQYSKLFDYLFTSLPGADATEQLNLLFAPDDRATFAANWNYGDHTVALQTYWIDGTGPEGPTRVASFVNHNLTYIYRASWDADISVGVRNLADRDPSFSSTWGRTSTNEADLYDVYGRTPFITYKQRF